MPPRIKEDPLPETFVLRNLYKVYRFINHIRLQLLVAVILVGTLALAWAVYKSMMPEPVAGPMPVVQAALTNENVLSWVNTAHKLAEKRRAGSFKVRVDSLKAFIEWARTRSTFLSDKLEGMSVQEFLGIAAGIENARRNIRIVVEYDMMVQEQYALLQLNPEIELPRLTQPALNPADQEDLSVYEYHLNTVEEVLYDLIPDIRLPVPAWEQQPATPPTTDEANEPSPSNPQNKVQWKVINRSRYGPKVIKVR